MNNIFESHDDEQNKQETFNTFEFRDDVVVNDPVEGDLVLCDNDEWAIFEMKSQGNKAHKAIFLFDKNDSDEFITDAAKTLLINYPKTKGSVMGINMSAYNYWKDEPESSDIVFIKITPKNFNKKYLMHFSKLNFGDVDI